MKIIHYRCFFTFILIFASSILYAQNNILKGQVVETDGSPVMYATVCVLNDGKVVAGVLTDTLGVFMIKGRFDGEYALRVTCLGYEETVRNVTLGKGKVIDYGKIVLSSTATELNGVVVTGQAVGKKVTMEMTRIMPSSSVSTTTGSLLDVLRGSSAVTIDGSGQVYLRGNSNILILVDGVPTTLEGLNSIPAANVQSIDIVTSPDAKYDAEGTGGVISITSKQQTADAFTAMASANYGFNNFMNGNLAMSYNVGRWGVRLNYNGKYEKDRIESELHRQILHTGNVLDQIINAKKKTTGHNIGMNVNYKMTKKDIITLDVKAGFPRMNNLQTFHNHYVISGIATEKQRLTDITFNREMLESSLTYKHIFQPNKREISTSASLSAINGHRPSYYYEAAQMVQRSESGGHPRIATWQLDYMAMLGKGKMETGIKMTYRQNNINHQMYEYDGETQTWQLSIPLSNDLRHREYIPAAYAMYSAKLNNKLTYKAGLRFEFSHVTLRNNKDHLDETNDYYFVAPNLVLNYYISEPWQLSLGLSRRISRPTYPQLNPYINLIDNDTYETGNVRLKPEKTNKLDIGYTYSGKLLTLNGNVYFNYTQDYIGQIAYLDQNVLVMTYINNDRYINCGIDHNVRWKILRWLNVDIGCNIYYVKSFGSYKNVTIRNQGWTSNNSASLNIMPLRGMNIQAQYFVTTPQYFPQFTTKTVHYCNLGIRQQLLKKGLTLSALLTDVFNTRRWDISSDNPIYTLVNKSKNRSRMLWLGISWNFHSYKTLGSQKKQEEDRSVIRLGE